MFSRILWNLHESARSEYTVSDLNDTDTISLIIEEINNPLKIWLNYCKFCLLQQRNIEDIITSEQLSSFEELTPAHEIIVSYPVIFSDFF